MLKADCVMHHTQSGDGGGASIERVYIQISSTMCDPNKSFWCQKDLFGFFFVRCEFGCLAGNETPKS